MTRKRAASPPARKPLRISNTLLAQDSSATQPAHGYRRHALTLPRVPFTVARQVIERRAPDSPILAMDDAGGLPYGGFLNSGGIGFGLFFPGYPYLAELAQLAAGELVGLEVVMAYRFPILELHEVVQRSDNMALAVVVEDHCPTCARR